MCPFVGMCASVGETLGVVACTPVDGEMSGAVEPGELVQPDTTAAARTAKVAQLTAVTFALAAVPCVIMRLTKPPYMPGGGPYR